MDAPCICRGGAKGDPPSWIDRQPWVTSSVCGEGERVLSIYSIEYFFLGVCCSKYQRACVDVQIDALKSIESQFDAPKGI